MRFMDAAYVTNDDTTRPGVQFVSDDGAWRVGASHVDDVREWFVWQRCDAWRELGGMQGHVRRLPGMRFVHREEAQAAAHMLSSLLFSAHPAQAILTAQERVRRLRAVVFFQVVSAVYQAAEVVRDRIRKRPQ